MSLTYLVEHAEAANIAIDLAECEAAHLRYTDNTLFSEPIDRAWVERLSQREDLAEKIDAFVGRFGRMQDHFGEKLLPAFTRPLVGQAKSLLDTLAYAELMGWVSSGEEFIGARKLRNLLVNEYITEPDLFLDALLAAKPATELLFQVTRSVKQEALSRGLGGHSKAGNLPVLSIQAGIYIRQVPSSHPEIHVLTAESDLHR